MSVLELLVLLIVLVYGARAVARLVRAVRADGPPGRPSGGPGRRAAPRGPADRSVQEAREPVRWPGDPDIEDARWVDLE